MSEPAGTTVAGTASATMFQHSYRLSASIVHHLEAGATEPLFLGQLQRVLAFLRAVGPYPTGAAMPASTGSKKATTDETEWAVHVVKAALHHAELACPSAWHGRHELLECTTALALLKDNTPSRITKLMVHTALEKTLRFFCAIGWVERVPKQCDFFILPCAAAVPAAAEGAAE